MGERLEDMIVILEDAAYIRRERLNGDPERGPDETTEEDVVEAMFRNKLPEPEIRRLHGPYTRALRLMIKGLTERG